MEQNEMSDFLWNDTKKNKNKFVDAAVGRAQKTYRMFGGDETIRNSLFAQLRNALHSSTMVMTMQGAKF